MSVVITIAHKCARCGRTIGHVLAFIGYYAFPASRVDWEAVKYAQWLERHAR